jgi:hypothetical protein
MKYNFNDTLDRLCGAPLTAKFCGMHFQGDQTDEAAVKAWADDPVVIGDLLAHFILDVVEVESRDARGMPIPRKVSDKEKFERFQLAEKIYGRGTNGIVDITESERQLLKRQADVAGNAELMGLVWRWLEAPIMVKE